MGDCADRNEVDACFGDQPHRRERHAATGFGFCAPAHDLNGGAQTNPSFAGPLPIASFDMDEVAVWTRQLTVTAILAAYRARYPRHDSAAFLCPPSSGLYNLTR